VRAAPYRPDQARAAQLFASHLLLARRTCYRLQAANAATADGAAPVRAHAFCSADGRIHFAAPGFHTLLQLVWPDASHWMLPRALLPGLQGAPVPPVGPISVQVAPLGNLFQVSLQRQRVGLNPAEQAVAALVARHLSDKAIARQLNKSPATVRNQLHAIYQRLGLSGRMALADWVRTANASDGR
jgi:DNA-binding CsgD family transcriptional regulator